MTCNLTPFITAFVSWVVGFFSTYFVTGLLERRRAYRALVSEIEAIRSEFHDFARFSDIHPRAIENLKPLIFSAIPFLNSKKRHDARALWASFRDTDISKLEEEGFVASVSAALGDPIMTQQKAMDTLLDSIQDLFRSWP